MSDNQTMPPVESPRAPRKPNPAKKVKQEKSSLEANWIGILVLGFGVLCVVTVGILVLNKSSEGPSQQQALSVQSSQNQAIPADKNNKTDPEIPNSKQQESVQAPATSDQLAGTLKTMKKQSTAEEETNPFKAGPIPDIKPDDIKGIWEVRLNNGTAVVEMTDTTYRIIVADDDPKAKRFYSNGTYEVRPKGLLVLKPDMSIGAPQDGYFYMPVTRTPLPILVQRHKEYMLWGEPGPGSEMIAPSIHPFLRLAKDELAIWKKL